MVNIFDYTEFLKYFEDYYTEKKAADPDFAYSTVAQKAGFNNKGFAYNIFHGKRNISPANCQKISKALRHSRKEAKYFRLLVAFSQTNELARKKKLFDKICSMSAHGKGFTEAQLIAHDQYDFYSKWYHSAIRSLIGLYPIKDDYFHLARRVVPNITTGQAKKSVELLLRLGLAVRKPDGTLKLTHTSITTGREIEGLGLRNFHFQCTDLAKNAISTMDRSSRNITGLTLGVSRAAYEKICAKIALYQEELMNIANTSPEADRVYQLNFHFFPLSHPESKRGRK
jgi:uncharacterized protein (TIGR02147 family)